MYRRRAVDIDTFSHGVLSLQARVNVYPWLDARRMKWKKYTEHRSTLYLSTFMWGWIESQHWTQVSSHCAAVEFFTWHNWIGVHINILSAVSLEVSLGRPSSIVKSLVGEEVMSVFRCECFERTVGKSVSHFSFRGAADFFCVCLLPWRYRYKRCDPITSWVHVLIVWHQRPDPMWKKREAKPSTLYLAAGSTNHL